MRAAFKEYINELREDFGEVINISCNRRYEAESKPKPVQLSLLDYLPYNTYNSKYGIFENAKTMGFIMRVSHFSGMTPNTKQSLSSLITNDIPAHYTVQVI